MAETNTDTIDNTQVTNDNNSTVSTSSEESTSQATNEVPNFIEVYTYDDNGYYAGTSTAEKSPEDKDVIYLKPRNSTIDKPPEITEGKIQKWNGEGWDIVDNPNPTNKSTQEIISDLQTRVTELETKINKFEKLITGVIVSKLNVSTSNTTTTT